jgi:hypothetical protein
MRGDRPDARSLARQLARCAQLSVIRRLGNMPSASRRAPSRKTLDARLVATRRAPYSKQSSVWDFFASPVAWMTVTNVIAEGASGPLPRGVGRGGRRLRQRAERPSLARAWEATMMTSSAHPSCRKQAPCPACAGSSTWNPIERLLGGLGRAVPVTERNSAGSSGASDKSRLALPNRRRRRAPSYAAAFAPSRAPRH